VVGADTWPEIRTWREPERLLAQVTVAVVDRPEIGGSHAPTGAASAGVVRVEGPSLPISATLVRDRVRRRKSIRFLVPGAVADYIAKRGLYS
jgi:nicotinate-nucleotide adenylyltransferase